MDKGKLEIGCRVTVHLVSVKGTISHGAMRAGDTWRLEYTTPDGRARALRSWRSLNVLRTGVRMLRDRTRGAADETVVSSAPRLDK